MPVDPDKRKLREWKRAVKRRGGKRRRAELKRGLRDHPEDAAFDEENFGRHSSEALNGIDDRS